MASFPLFLFLLLSSLTLLFLMVKLISSRVSLNPQALQPDLHTCSLSTHPRCLIGSLLLPLFISSQSLTFFTTLAPDLLPSWLQLAAMARHSPEKPSPHRSRVKASRGYYLDAMRIPFSPIPRPSTRPPRRRAHRNKVKSTHHAPRYLHLSSLSSYHERTDKVNKSTGSRSQTANASTTARQGRHVPQYAYTIPLPPLSPLQDTTTPQPEVPSKRPHPITMHSDDHHESRPPQKRHCDRGDDAPGLFKRTSPKVVSSPLPSSGSSPSIPRDSELLGTVSDKAQKGSCRSTLPVVPWSSADSSREKHEPGMSVRSMGCTKSLFKSCDDVVVPCEKLDRQEWQEWQECEPIPRRIISTKHGLVDGAPRHQHASELSKTSSNKENLLHNPKKVAARISRLWLFFFACLLGAFIGGMVLHGHLAPEFPTAKWELNDHESLRCSGDKVKTCSW